MWLLPVETGFEYSMKIFRVDDREEFIWTKLRSFCKEKDIAIKYAAPYIHEENGLTKQKWRRIVIMKDMMPINSGL